MSTAETPTRGTPAITGTPALSGAAESNSTDPKDVRQQEAKSMTVFKHRKGSKAEMHNFLRKLTKSNVASPIARGKQKKTHSYIVIKYVTTIQFVKQYGGG